MLQKRQFVSYYWELLTEDHLITILKISTRNLKREPCIEHDPVFHVKKMAIEDKARLLHSLNGYSESKGSTPTFVDSTNSEEPLQLTTKEKNQGDGRNEFSTEDSFSNIKCGQEIHNISCNGIHSEVRPLDLSLETSKHLLERLSPKGGCVQCGKDGRLTKRGRPHESYFGCKLCRVHLCRKRNCFDVWHTVS